MRTRRARPSRASPPHTGTSTPWTAAGATLIGSAERNGGPVDFTGGQIDDAHFYHRVLTSTEITTLATG